MLGRIPKQTLSQVVSRVTFPVFASIQDQPERLQRGVRKALLMLVLTNFPLMAGLGIVAEPLVVTLLTERWLPVVPLLQLLSLVGMLYPMHSVNLSLLQASGRSDLYLRISVIKPVLSFVNIAATWHMGLRAMITGQIVVSLVAYFLNARYAHAVVGYGIRKQLRDVFPYAAATAVMAGAGWAAGIPAYPAPIVEILVQVLAGVVVYAGACWLLRLDAFFEVLQETRARLRRNA
jgi:O-antigen/teichoic acid export membrane protein